MRIYAFITSAAMIAAAACAPHHDHDHESGDSHEEHEGVELHENHEDHDGHGESDGHGGHDDPALVELSHEAARAAGITLETVKEGPFRTAVRAAAVIEPSRGQSRVIVAPASGTVSFLTAAVQGSQVANGERLFTISSRGLEASDASASARAELAAAKKNLERVAALEAEGLVAKRELDEAQAAYARAEAGVAGIATKASSSGVTASSPMSGYLTNVTVTPGSFVNAGDPLATVSTERRVMLKAELSPRHRDFASSVVSANLSTGGKTIPLSGLHPKVTRPGTIGSSEIHFIPLYIEFDNPGGLGSGTVGEAWLLGPSRMDVITIPNGAIVEEGGYKYVYTRADDDHEVYRKQEVTTGTTDGVRTEIISGLKEGEIVAATGARRIRLASMSASIPAHSHNH